MSAQAFFGRPREGFSAGGAHLCVYLVPVFEGRLVAFDVRVRGAEGRWLPWDILSYGGNPYEDATELTEEWCQGAVDDLRLVDVMTRVAEGSWELSLVFRANLGAMPAEDAARTPIAIEPGDVEAIQQFDAIDLLRWMEAPASGGRGAAAAGRGLIF